MEFGRRHVLYILGAFVLLVLLQALGEIINMKLDSLVLDRLLNSGATVVNILGVLVGLYNIYRGLQLRTIHPMWIVFFLLGVSCIFINVVALSG